MHDDNTKHPPPNLPAKFGGQGTLEYQIIEPGFLTPRQRRRRRQRYLMSHHARLIEDVTLPSRARLLTAADRPAMSATKRAAIRAAVADEVKAFFAAYAAN